MAVAANETSSWKVTNVPQSLPTDVGEHLRLQLEHACRRGSVDRELPFVTLSYAQSLDGSIARSEGETAILSNANAQRLTHQVRAMHDGILVGINTVLRDNPRLNVRLVEGSNPQPIVVDSQLRFPLNANLLRDPCVRPLIITTANACPDREAILVAAGARIVRLSERTDGWIDLVEVLRQLKQRGMQSIMIEGGASIITSVFKSRLADQVMVTISMRILGGLRSVRKMASPESSFAPHLCNLCYEWLEDNLIVCGELDRAADMGERCHSEIACATALTSSPRHDSGLGGQPTT